MIIVDFKSLVNYYDKIIEYAEKTCECFSVITKLEKPYSKVPPNCAHDEILEILRPFILRQIIGVRKWSYNGTKGNHAVMNVYSCSKKSLNALRLLPNMLLPIENGLPEDICFYSNGAVWLTTISHEEIAYIHSETESDISFLKEVQILYNISPFQDEQYHLPYEEN